MVKKITAEQLADGVDADEQFTLIDVRPEGSFEAWHVRNAKNVPYDPGEELSEDQLNVVNTLVDGRPVVAICGKGLTSTPFAFDLNEHGYDDVSEFLGLDRDAFVERLTENAPEKPPNYETVIAINTGKETVDDESEATELELGANNCAT